MPTAVLKGKPLHVKCQYCLQPSEIVTGAKLYPHRPDLRDKPFYFCKGCQAWVGCHPGTYRPLGKLADFELRQYKRETHEAFDPIWKGGAMTRTQAYVWLANSLHIFAKDCHIGYFDVETCKKVIQLCNEKRKTLHEPASGNPFL